jgi:O-methyltransferase
MKQIAIFGAGGGGYRIYRNVADSADVIAVVDNDRGLWGEPFENGLTVSSPDLLTKIEFDEIIISVFTEQAADEIRRQLTGELLIPDNCITVSDFSKSFAYRNKFLEYFSEYVYTHGFEGSVAEGGVWRGDFAYWINRLFPDRKFYLFDTFKGFDKKDIDVESANSFCQRKAGKLGDTSLELVLSRLKGDIVVKQGFFPDTFDIDDGQFVFVNLDFDLYAPTKSGLELFYPRMVGGGIILIHDYFNLSYTGIKKAVDEFCTENRVAVFPIGDMVSIGIVKQ